MFNASTQRIFPTIVVVPLLLAEDPLPNFLSKSQRCQTAYFQTKNNDFGEFLVGLAMKDVGLHHMSLRSTYFTAIYYMYFIAIWYILWLFGIFYDYLVYFMVIWYIKWLFGIFFGYVFGIFYGYLVYFSPCWHVLSKKIWQP
jgi:hypothetical protein